MLMPLVALAVGQAHAGTYPPLITQGQFDFEGNLVWSAVEKIPDLPLNGIFNDVSCSKQSCVAVGLGVAEIIPKIILQPLIAQRNTNDRNPTWKTIALENQPDNGKFYHSICSDDLCFALGEDTKQGKSILARQDADDLNSWNYVSLDLPSKASIENITCTSVFCLAAGGDPNTYNGHAAPLILKSVDQGNTWETSLISGELPATGAFFDVRCGKDLCVAVGQNTAPQKDKPPILAQSRDQGKSWQMVSISNLPENGFFYRASCFENHCVAAGAVGVYEHPLLAESHDGGQSWSVPQISNAPQHAFFNQVWCDAQFCIAVGGQGDLTDAPFVARGDDTGRWENITIAPLPIHLRLSSVHCTSDFCLTSGGSPYMHAEEPAGLLQSFDQGKSWKRVTIKNIPEKGIFNGDFIL